MDGYGGENTPLVSVGLPVYNGEKYIEEALESIIAQTYANIEVIICDNASIDRTPEICSRYKLSDKRIKYYKNHENLGAARNFNRAFHLSRGKYFMWAPHDDIFSPVFLEHAVDVLNKNPHVVLCYAQEVGINEKGEMIGDRPYSLKSDYTNPQDRFKYLLQHDRGSPPIFGLMRSRILKETSLIGSYNGSDQVLLAELIIRGKFYQLPLVKFYHREHQGRSVYENHDRYSVAVWFDPVNQKKYIFPEWSYFLGYCHCINNAPISIVRKIYCYIQMAKWLRKNNFSHFRRMAEDLFVISRYSDVHVHSDISPPQKST